MSACVEQLILVVDDDVGSCVMAQLILEGTGRKVITANNAMEALLLVEANADLDLIFSDVQMPGAIDGHEMILELRRRGVETPAILTSGGWQASSSLPRHTRFIGKPYRAGELTRQVAELVAEAG